MTKASVPAPAAKAKNGSIGVPGSKPNAAIRKPDIPSAFGYMLSWPNTALSVEPMTPDFETKRPAAVDTVSAGICVTRPSPTVRIE